MWAGGNGANGNDNANYDGYVSSRFTIGVAAWHPDDAETFDEAMLGADQALVDKDHLNAMLAAWSGGDEEIIATAFAGAQGPPVLMPRSSFSDLAKLSGDVGAKKLLDSGDYKVSTIWCDAAGIDIDRPEDLSNLTGP